MPVICRFPAGTVVDTQLSETSKNPIANKTVTTALKDVYKKSEVDNLIDDSKGLILTSTLTAGQTSLTFTDARITTNSILDSVYTSKFGVGISSAEITDGSLVVTLKAQGEDLTIKVVIM